MKPTMLIENEDSARETRRLPKVDFQYQAISTGHVGGCCAQLRTPSFRNISRSYFDTEENHYFMVEATVFAAITLAAAVPLINGASAVLHLIRACAGV